MNLTQLLMNQLMSKNPKMYQEIQKMQKNGTNPQDYLNQIMKNYSPEQISKFVQYAQGFGITEEQLNNYGINRNVWYKLEKGGNYGHEYIRNCTYNAYRW